MNENTKKEQAIKRLERCKTCTCPDNPKTGLCPGNMGIGCIGDWRCCAEMDAVCKDCNIYKHHYLYCENVNCQKMNDFRNK